FFLFSSHAAHRLLHSFPTRRSSDLIFSEQQKSLLENYGVPAPNVAVIPNGVDVDKYTPGSSAFKQTSQASTLVGYLGRVDPEKRSEEHTSELQSLAYLVCRLLLEKK